MQFSAKKSSKMTDFMQKISFRRQKIFSRRMTEKTDFDRKPEIFCHLDFFGNYYFYVENHIFHDNFENSISRIYRCSFDKNSNFKFPLIFEP